MSTSSHRGVANSNAIVTTPASCCQVPTRPGRPTTTDNKHPSALGHPCPEANLSAALLLLAPALSCLVMRPLLRGLLGEWPGALQPQALAEPYVTVSRHTAPTIQSWARTIRQWAKSLGSRVATPSRNSHARI